MEHLIRSRMASTLVSIVISLIVVLPIMAVAAPTVTIYTDSDTYVAGDTIEVSLSTENPGSGMSVAVYIGLLTSDGVLYILGPGGWTNAVLPWISSIYHPGGWGLPRTVFWTFDIPCPTPPIANPGPYIFASVLTHPWTFDLVCDPSFAPFSISSASDLWVDGAAGNDSNDGSEAFPFLTITHALDVASGSPGNPVTIHVAACTYAAGTNGETFPLSMESWVSLMGEDRDTTILDAEYAAHHVIYCNSVSDLTIEGFSMTGGYASEVGLLDPDACGGGIYLNDSSPIIQDNIIAGNVANRYGGGICCFFMSSPTIQHNTIWANWAKYEGGGGISCMDSSSPVIVNNLILDNWLTGDFEGGGGIDCRILSSPTIRNSTIVGNEVDMGGDGIYCDMDSIPTTTDCILWGNGDEYGSDDLYGCSATYCCIEDLDAGVGNTHDDPLFVPGPFGNHYLDPTSLCIDAGSQSATAAALDDRTTQADSTFDSGTVDLGYHYPIVAGEAPTAYIDSIAPNPATQGYDDVEFMGHGEDTDGSVVAYKWSSDLDGILSTDEDFNVEASALSVGNHLISYRVQDNDSLWSASETANLVIEAGNKPPTATIDDIYPNPAWQCEHEVTFIGHGEDSDGTIVGYEWSSDLDGILSTNIDFQIEALDLSLGDHAISFRVQDNEGAWSLPDTRTLTIEPGSRLYVDAATGDDSNDGSEGHPFRTITHALDVAGGTDKCPITIFVAAGTYAGSTNGEMFPLVMKSWVSIIGESSKTTILDAQGKAHHVIYCDSVANLSVEGFTIMGGNTAGATEPDTHGAGIFCSNSSLEIRDNVIRGNDADGDQGRGGGVYCFKSSATILSNLITENTADTLFGSGGGICCDNCSPTISTNTITENLAGDALGAGGGIYCRDSSPTIDNNVLSRNEAGWGGAIACASTGSPTITNNTVSNNYGNCGGGMLCSGDASPLITDNDITLNAAEYGGGIGCYAGLPTIEYNTISENEATVGAGIYCAEEGAQTIQYNTISSNAATEHGGGIACTQSSPTILNNDIVSNSAVEHGGGIHCLHSSSPTITDNVIQANEAEFGGGVLCYGSSPTITDNIIQANEAVSGGGIACYSFSSPIVEGNTITLNICDHDGGGIVCFHSAPVIERNTISGNSAALRGGGIEFWECPGLTISGNSLMDNSAGRGGGIHSMSDLATIEHNVIVHNSATGDPGNDHGGGICCASDSSPTIRNNLIALNFALDHGGGIACTHADASPTISNNTIVSNYATGSGDGIYCEDACFPTVINCILWGNGDDLFNCSATYCCIEDFDAGTGNVHTDPWFQTGFYGDYYLSSIAAGQASDSDCINMGSMSAVAAGLSDRTTQTNNAPDTGTVDMGYHYPIP